MVQVATEKLYIRNVDTKGSSSTLTEIEANAEG